MKIGLKEIIGQFLNSSDRSSHEFLRLWNMGVWGIKTEFNIPILGVIETVLLDVSANKTIRLPDNYMSGGVLGRMNERGEIIGYDQNPQLSNYNATNTTKSRLTGLDTESIVIDYNVVCNIFNESRSIPFQLFGLGSGTPWIGDYKIDKNSGVILLNPNTTDTELLFQYTSNGYSECCDDHEIDSMAGEAMLCYLRWYNAKDKFKQFSQNDVRVFKKEFYRAKGLAIQQMNPVIVADFEKIKRRLTKLVAHA